MDAVRIWCMPWHVWKLLWKLCTDQYWINAVCVWNLLPETKNKKYRENGIKNENQYVSEEMIAY